MPFVCGGAIHNCIRQIGAVLGISGLVVLLGTSAAGEALHVFHRRWWLIAFSGVVAALAGLALGRGRAGYPDAASASTADGMVPVAAGASR